MQAQLAQMQPQLAQMQAQLAPLNVVAIAGAASRVVQATVAARARNCHDRRGVPLTPVPRDDGSQPPNWPAGFGRAELHDGAIGAVDLCSPTTASRTARAPARPLSAATRSRASLGRCSSKAALRGGGVPFTALDETAVRAAGRAGRGARTISAASPFFGHHRNPYLSVKMIMVMIMVATASASLFSASNFEACAVARPAQRRPASAAAAHPASATWERAPRRAAASACAESRAEVFCLSSKKVFFMSLLFGTPARPGAHDFNCARAPAGPPAHSPRPLFTSAPARARWPPRPRPARSSWARPAPRRRRRGAPRAPPPRP